MNSSVPGDKDMVEHFQIHRDKFIQLVEMLKIDGKIEHLWPDSITPEGIIDEKRWNVYRSIMSSARIRGIHSHWGANSHVKFRTDTKNYLSRFDKGYFWSSNKPVPLSKSLDSQIEKIQPYAIHYKQIKGNWYLYLENQSD